MAGGPALRRRRVHRRESGPLSGEGGGPTGAAERVVVLDTNVFVGAGFNPGSASAEIIEAVRAGELRMVWSDATRAETERIVRKIPPLDWAGFEGVFREGDRVEPALAPDAFPEVSDEEDRKFAALAASAGAVLISSDHHLLDPARRESPPEGYPEVRAPGRWWRDGGVSGPEAPAPSPR